MFSKKLTSFLGALVVVGVTALPSFAMEPVKEITSPKGLKAWLIEDHSNPIISVEIGFRGGAGLESDTKSGLANMVASLIDEGAGDYDSQAFQNILEERSISLSFHSGIESFGGSLKSLSEDRNEAFRLLKLALTKPRFDDEAVERVRSQILAGIRQSEENPDAVAAKTFNAKLFGNHPYGRSTDGTLESVAAITPTDMREFTKQRFAKDNLIIGVVGDIDPDSLGKLIDTTFVDLPDHATAWTLPEIVANADGSTTIVEKNVPQSTIQFGLPAIKRDDPDFYAGYVMNYILGGGGFASRLTEEVREKRGLVYSVYSYLHPMDYSAIWAGGAGTKNERVKETLDVVKAEITRLGEKGVSAEELKNAKTYLTGSFPLRFTATDRIASMLASMQMDGLGRDYIEKRNSYIEAVTLEDVNRVAKRLMKPELLTFIIVGKPEGVK